MSLLRRALENELNFKVTDDKSGDEDIKIVSPETTETATERELENQPPASDDENKDEDEEK